MRAHYRPLSRLVSFRLYRRIIPLSLTLILLTCGVSAAADKNFSAGVAEFKLRHFNQAAEIFEKCMAAGSNDADLYYYAAITYEHLGNYKKAFESYRFAIEHFPTSQAARCSAAAMQRKSFQSSLASQGLLMNPRDPLLDNYPKETWVGFTRHNNSLVLDGSINDRATKMIFDTGASSCVFSVDQLERLGIEPPQGPPNAITYGVGSNRKIPVWATKANLRLGKIERKEFPIIVSPNPLIYPLLGEDFFHDLKYTIDNRAKAILFKYSKDSRTSSASTNTTSAMTVSSSANYVYSVPFTVENRALVVVAKLDGRSCPMIFDTGADVCMFTNEELSKVGVKPRFVGRTLNVRGASGTAPAQLGVISKAELGPISGEMACLVTDQAVVPRPLMGQSFFKDWQYTIDHTNRVIQFVRK